MDDPRVCQFCASWVPDGHECDCQVKQKESARIRKFDSGATRDTDVNKLDYEAFLSPLVLKRYAEYLNKNRKLKDGTLRDGDNWQLGIPFTAYIKSLWRHFMDVWTIHRRRLTSEITSYAEQDEFEEALCAVIFNASGYLHEQLKKPLLLSPAEAGVSPQVIYGSVYRTTETPEAYKEALCEDYRDPPVPAHGWPDGTCQGGWDE